MGTNYDHLCALSARRMAQAIWRYAQDYCAYCPKNIGRRCDEDCAGGVKEWLMSPFIPSSDIWEER